MDRGASGKKKHIGFIIDSMGGGGAERVISVLTNKFIEEDYAVSVITFSKSKFEYQLNPLINRVELFVNGKAVNKLIKTTFILHQEMKKSNCDIYISFGILGNITSCLCKIITDIKLVISERNAPKEVKLSFATKVLRKLLYRKADGFVFQTEGAKKFYSKSIQKRSFVIANPIKENLPYKSKNTCKNEMVAVGRLVAQKNYPLLIKAFNEFNKEVPGYTLSIYGQGILEENLKKMAEELDIAGAIKFNGFCMDVHNEIKEAKLFVMTSDYEGMPNALMEAMAMGLPVISTDCPSGGPREIISNGNNGFLVEVGNKEQLVEKMIYLIRDEKTYMKFCESGKEIRARYSTNQIFEKWKECVQAVLNRN